MEVLELKKLNNKSIIVYLLKSSDKTYEFLKNIPLTLSTVDLTEGDFKKFEKTSLAKLLNILHIPIYQVDMPQHARDYIYVEISELDEEINQLLEALEKVKDKESHKAESLKCWIENLTEELKEKKKIVERNVRPTWIVKKVLDLVAECKSEKVSLVHITKDNIFTELVEQFKKLGIEVIICGDNIIHVIPNKAVVQEEINPWKY